MWKSKLLIFTIANVLQEFDPSSMTCLTLDYDAKNIFYVTHQRMLIMQAPWVMFEFIKKKLI